MRTDIPHPDLLADALAYCEARDVPRTRFGRDAINDANLLRDLAGGRELRRPTVEAVRRYMVTGQPIGPRRRK